MGKLSKPKGETITPQQILELTRQQQVMNNPNVSNIFGSTSTTFDANDQAHVTQTLSPEMQGLVNQQMEFVGRGANEYKPRQGGFNQGMIDKFSSNLANRSGYQLPERNVPQVEPIARDKPVPQLPSTELTTPQPPANGIGQPPSNLPNINNIPLEEFYNRGRPTPVNRPKSALAQKVNEFSQLMSGEKEGSNPLAKALLKYGGR